MPKSLCTDCSAAALSVENCFANATWRHVWPVTVRRQKRHGTLDKYETARRRVRNQRRPMHLILVDEALVVPLVVAASAASFLEDDEQQQDSDCVEHEDLPCGEALGSAGEGQDQTWQQEGADSACLQQLEDVPDEG